MTIGVRENLRNSLEGMKWNLLEKLGGSAEGVIGTSSPVTRECTLRRKDSEREGQVTTWLRHKQDQIHLSRSICTPSYIIQTKASLEVQYS